MEGEKRLRRGGAAGAGPLAARRFTAQAFFSWMAFYSII
jgi:hypothetical protein